MTRTINARLLMFTWTIFASCLLLVPVHTGRPDFFQGCPVARKQHLQSHFLGMCFPEWVQQLDAAYLARHNSPPASVQSLQGSWRKHQANTSWRASTVEDALGFVFVNLRCFPLPPKSFPSTLPHDLAKLRVMWLWVNRMRTDLDKDTAVGRCTDNGIVHSLD